MAKGVYYFNNVPNKGDEYDGEWLNNKKER
jgi:hypothetical protein